MQTLERLKTCGVVPVVVLNDAADAVPTAKALLDGGIDSMEITFRTAAAAEAISRVAKACPDMLVGAGTVITAAQCEEAISRGARFIVSPGLSEPVAAAALAHGIPVLPGCVTPTEIIRAMELGLSVLKFFPARVYGGLSALKALAAPFGGISFLPTGGVGPDNLEEYLSAPFVFGVGGSWLCNKKDIEARNFEKITALCREAKAAVNKIRR